MTKAENPALPDEEYSYDAVGNRQTSADTNGTWSYNANNELLSYNNATCSFDENGNMVKRVVDGKVTRYIYNANNRLIRVEDGSGNVIARYYYDPFGRRLWKEVNGERTYFHYSKQGLIAEYDDQGDPIRFYGYKPGSSWTTDPLFLKKDGSYYFYHNDHLGTPQKMTSSNGAVVWSANHESFGEAKVEKQEVSNPLRFPGQYHDQETGLHYNYHRYYDPEIGRYLREDPSGTHKGQNLLFIYVNNNPLINIDPFGLIPKPTKIFCLYTYYEARRACGDKFEKKRKAFQDYLDWCQCAWNYCRCKMGQCSPNVTDQDCKKFNNINSASMARTSCMNSPEGFKVLKQGSKCLLKMAELAKCLGW